MAYFDDHTPAERDRVGGRRARGAGCETLCVASVEMTPLRVAVTPFPSLLTVVDALGGRADETPSDWRATAAAALRSRDRAALLPVVARPGGFVPDCVLSFPQRRVHAIDEAFDRIAATAPEQLLAELTGEDGPGLGGPWAAVAHNPEAWLKRYAAALRKIWRAIRDRWMAGAGPLEREVERVGVAAARGSALDALRPLDLGGDLHDGVWVLPAARRRKLRVADAGLVLMPMLARPCASRIRAYAGDALTHLAYPVPGAARLMGDKLPAPSSLEALLGPARTAILRQLDRPAPVGRLAESLFAVPSAATHHATALETAGLVERERQGRHVLVRRTARGTALLALYERA